MSAAVARLLSAPFAIAAVLAAAAPALAGELAEALAADRISATIAAQGLRATEAQLAALPDPTATQRFALGGVRFLGGVERALQSRWRHGLSEGLATLSGLPFLRLPIPENAAPEPFAPADIAALFAAVTADMEGAIAALGPIGADDAVALRIDTADLWFDIDMDGRRSPGEGLTDVVTLTLGEFGPPMPDVTIRFDTADAAWLAAYAHMLAGFGELVLAFDPTATIARVLDSRAAFAALAAEEPGAPAGPGSEEDFTATQADFADLAAMALGAIEVRPDPARTRAVRAHWLAMIADNRAFWDRVAAETDNDAEWIPNKAQLSATGLPFPPQTAQRWQAVLADAEAALTGRALIPHWRLPAGAGFDLGRMLEDPPMIDVVGLLQGADILPYAARGRVLSLDSLRSFARMAGGDAALFVVILN